MKNKKLAKNEIYLNSPDNKYRYALGIKGNNTLYCIGINPSTATPENYDRTMNKVRRVSQVNGFDSFVTLNIYPFRARDPDNLPKNPNVLEHKKNMEKILRLIKDRSTMWAAWGNSIDKRPWLRDCLNEILRKIQKNKKGINWVKMGDLTIRQNPRHPLYTRNQNFTEFNI